MNKNKVIMKKRKSHMFEEIASCNTSVEDMVRNIINTYRVRVEVIEQQTGTTYYIVVKQKSTGAGTPLYRVKLYRQSTSQYNLN